MRSRSDGGYIHQTLNRYALGHLECRIDTSRYQCLSLGLALDCLDFQARTDPDPDPIPESDDASSVPGPGPRPNPRHRVQVMSAQWYDANISLPGCDKNMPGTVIAMARLNRPSIMVYGGTIKPGFSALDGGKLDVVSAFQSFGTHSTCEP